VNFSGVSADTGTIGNPALKPYLSDNIDLGIDWYTGREGYVSLTVFQKRWMASPSTKTSRCHSARWLPTASATAR
jgi:outer membrane receptor for ferrienterochelin and colicin